MTALTCLCAVLFCLLGRSKAVVCALICLSSNKR